MRRTALLAAVALAAAAHRVPVAAQEPVTGVKVELVRLDAVVTDKSGGLVRNLSAADFLVLEDGRPQKLASFTATGTGRAPATPADPAASGGPGRHVVIVVDDLHIATPHLESAKRALVGFIDELAAQDDQLAVITTSGSGSAPLSSDRASLRLAITALRARELAVVASASTHMSPAQAEMVLRGDDSAIRLAARALLDEPGSLYDQGQGTPKSALSREVGIAGTNSPRENAAAVEARRQAAPILAEALRFSVASLAVIERALRSLASLPGRKMCLVVSDGFVIGAGTGEERTRELDIVVDAATRSGAVVYALDSRGLLAPGGDAGNRSLTVMPGIGASVDRHSEQLLRGTLERLTDRTGGFLVTRTNDLAGGLRLMLEDNESYYLMAYEPTNPRRQGRFRKIAVRIAGHPDYTVRTRRGYLEPDDRKGGAAAATIASAPLPAPVAPADALSEEEARALLASAPSAAGLPVRLTADYLDLPPAGPQAVVHAHVATAGLAWLDEAGLRKASLDLVGGVFDEAGQMAGLPFGRRTELEARPDDPRAVDQGLEFQQRLPLKPGSYEVRFLAREVGTGRLGVASQRLQLPDLTDQKLMMSGVFLASAGEGPTMRDAQARRVFARGTSVAFQLYVYNAKADEKGVRDVVLQAQIWSAGKVITASKPQPAALQSSDGVPMPETNVMSLEGLDPGAYELRVLVVDRKANLQILRRTDFTVE